MAKKYFLNPLNNYKVNDGGRMSILWCFLLGPLYFAIRGNWSWFFIGLILLPTTLFTSFLILPFFARKINETQISRKGYVRCSKT